MRLGKHQLCLLATMASPFSLLVVKDKIAASLAEKGLIAPHSKAGDSFFGITPAGLRVLADAIERGEVDQFFDPKFERDRVRMHMSAKKAA